MRDTSDTEGWPEFHTGHVSVTTDAKTGTVPPERLRVALRVPDVAQRCTPQSRV